MDKPFWNTAEEIVGSFVADLNDVARDNISEAQLTELKLMISEAMAAKASKIAHQVEDLAHRLSAEAGKKEIGL